MPDMNNKAFKALCDDLQRHRIVTAEELRLAGADDDAIKRAKSNGSLQAIPGVRGLYVVGKQAYDEFVLMHGASRHAGEGAVITGIWATRLLKMRWIPEAGACMVRIPAARHRRGSEGYVTVCRTASHERLDTWEHKGLLVAQPALAVVDACRQVPSDPATRSPRRPERELQAVRGIVLGAVADKRCTLGQLEGVLSQGSIRWTAHTRRALTDAARGAASPPEAELVDGMLPYGVPFYCNVEVWRGDELLGVLDLYLVGTATGGEMDSKERHSGELLDLTFVRDDTFEDVGIHLRHIAPTRYRADPEAFHRLLLRVAAKRLADGHRDPEGLRFVPRGPLLCGPVSGRTPYLLRAA